MGKHKKRGKQIIKNTIININEVINDGTDDKEQRRVNRLPAILSIVAVTGVIYPIVLNYAKDFLNIYVQQGIITGIFSCLFIVALSAIISTVFDIVSYVFSDINRYNILNEDYEKHDKISDKKYNILLKNFMFYIVIVIYLFFVLLMVFAWLDGDYTSKVLGVITLIMLVYVTCYLIRYALKKCELKKYLLIMFRGVGIGLISMLFIAVIIDNRTSVISVEFQSDGNVEILDETVYGYDDFIIEIYDSNMQLVYSKNVNDKDALYASEDSYITQKVGEEWIEKGKIIDAQERFWKYYFSIDDVIVVDGKYQFQINIEQENSSVVLKNEFYKQDKTYVFAIDNIIKEY